MSTPGPLPSSGRSELDRLRQAVSTYFPVYDTRLGPQSVLFAVYVDRGNLETKFESLRRELDALGYIPILRRETGEEFVEVIRRPKLAPRRSWINVVLLSATVATTVFAGAMLWLAYVGELGLGPGDLLYGALYFAAPLLAILGIHELAHYVVARRRHLDASLPYFIPIPPPYILGTFGAFVSIREPFPDRKTLFDVGVAGPLAGFAMSIPITLLGLSLSVHSPVLPANYCGPSILGQSYGNLLVGQSLLFGFLAGFFPSSISLHPLALAGWVGILVTAINLIPAGQLDGGHVFRALLGERARYVSYAAAALLFGLGVVFYLGWVLFGFVVLLIGMRHPPPLNDTTPLDRKRYAVGIAAAVLLVCGFVLVPLAIPPGSISLSGAGSSATTAPHGATIAAVLDITVTNGDPIPHAFVYTFAVENVSLVKGQNLTGTNLSTWEESGNWTFRLPGGTTLGPFAGASATLPSADFVTINATASYVALVEFTNSQTAHAVGFSFQTNELCPTSGGSASTGLPAVTFL